MSNYKLVFDGTISDGYQVEDVKKNLAAVLKANENQIELLFSKPEVIIKKNMDYESAVKYQKAMQKAGTICKVMEIARNQAAVPAETASPVNATAQSTDPPGMPAPSAQRADQAASSQAQHFSQEPVMGSQEPVMGSQEPVMGFQEPVMGFQNPVMEIGETNLPKDFQYPSAAVEDTKEPVENKIGRGIGDIVAGVVLIGIGLVWGGSIFLGTADALDVFFDGLGIFWIVKGIYKMIS
jgi:hypothetical protein